MTGTTPTTTPTTPTTTTTATATTATTTTTTPSSTTAAASDRTVAARLKTASVKRTALGSRILAFTVVTQEPTSMTLKLKRGSKVVKRKSVASLAKGTHSYRLAVPAAVPAGRLVVELAFTDAADNTRVIQAMRHLPAVRS